MRPALAEQLPLICPACKWRDEAGVHLHSLALVERWRGDGEVVLDGALECENAACRRRFPVVDGIPILVAYTADYVQREIASIVESPLAPGLAALLCAGGPDDSHYARLHEHLSIYLDAAWGDRAQPPPDGPARSAGFGFGELAAWLRERQSRPVQRAVELGCGVGRGLAELAPGAGLVVGVDLHFGALRRARRLLAGEALDYPRRVAGRSYQEARLVAGPPASNVLLVCGDALDPPLPPGCFGRVAALNLLDSVRAPATLLAVLDGLCAPGGELLLTSPYAWQSGIVDEAERLGGADPAADLRWRLGSGYGLSSPYTLEEQRSLPWRLRRDARSAVIYDVDAVRARKAAPRDPSASS